MWKAGVALAGVLLLLVLIAWIPVLAVGAHEVGLGSATPGTVMAQVTPTEDATVTALNKEKLAQEVQQLKQQNEPNFLGWLGTNASILLSTLVVVIGGLIGLWRWLRDRRDAQDKELRDRQIEREKRAEERFQSVVTGLGDEKEGAKVGAAILLRTFLHPGYEQFYIQTFDLAVAHLRLPRNPHPPEDPEAPLPLTSLSQALIVVFKEAFSLARQQNQGGPQSLDATGVQLDNAYLLGADLKHVWMRKASIRDADFGSAILSNAHLFRADLSGAWLWRADLRESDLRAANLSKANLRDTDFRRANLREVNFNEADLSKANLNGADLNGTSLEATFSLEDTDLRGVKGLPKEQLATCKAKGAIIDEDATTEPSQPTVSVPPPEHRNDAHASSVPFAQGNVPTPDPGGNSTASFQQEPGS